MKLIALLIATLALTSGSAQAWEITTHCTYSQFYGKTCRTIGREDPVRDPAQEAADLRARQEEDRKWAAFCKPARTHDDLGVVRLVYARPGCEFGRTE